MKGTVNLVAATTAVFGLTGCDRTDPKASPQQAAMAADDPVASAMTAAPDSVAAKAAVVMLGKDGTIKTLRAGSNGYTCMPDNPVTPGPDPMCMDTNALAWAMAWLKHQTPQAETPGFIYMLAGGTDASNSDPFADKPTGEGDWIKTGPHVMIVGSTKALAGYPSGPKPDISQPYVMWAGTPWAHLMIPVN